MVTAAGPPAARSAAVRYRLLPAEDRCGRSAELADLQAGPQKRIVAMVGKWAAGAKILIVPLLVTFARGTESLTGTAMSGELRCGRASAVNRMCFACACLI
jgi:hypothetical protein